MTTEEPISFIDYWDAVDAAMLKFFGIDTGDAGIEADRIAHAQEIATPLKTSRSGSAKNTASGSRPNGEIY